MENNDTAEALSRLTAEISQLRSQVSSPPALLSYRKAAKLLGIDRGATLHALIRSGQLKTVKVNGSRRIPLVEVNRLATTGFDVTAVAKRAKRLPPQTAQTDPSTWKLRT